MDIVLIYLETDDSILFGRIFFKNTINIFIFILTFKIFRAKMQGWTNDNFQRRIGIYEWNLWSTIDKDYGGPELQGDFCGNTTEYAAVNECIFGAGSDGIQQIWIF